MASNYWGAGLVNRRQRETLVNMYPAVYAEPVAVRYDPKLVGPDGLPIPIKVYAPGPVARFSVDWDMIMPAHPSQRDVL